MQTKDINRSREEIRSWIRGYTALIHLLDDQIGRIVDYLENAGLLHQTLMVYTSDHGDMLGSQGLTHKQLPFEESIHVPLIISWPGRIQPGTARGQIGLVDLPVTILALLGLSFSHKVDGEDLSNLLFDPDSPGLEGSLICDLVPCHQAADRGQDAWVGIRTPTHTFARWADGSPYICFDNQSDPYQLTNLIEMNNGLTRQLSDEVDRLLSRYNYQFRPWQEMVRQDGYTRSWNRSQSYFNRPILVE
jgi:arylsulfatase A-like enzyme